jgi:hypothetical protein
VAGCSYTSSLLEAGPQLKSVLVFGLSTFELIAIKCIHYFCYQLFLRHLGGDLLFILTFSWVLKQAHLPRTYDVQITNSN